MSRSYQHGYVGRTRELAEFDRARSRQLSRVPGFEQLAYLPETEMVVWSFPNDRKLTHLPQLLNLEFLASYLPATLTSLGLGDSREIETIATEVLHYLPERSCMIRYRLTIETPVDRGVLHA